ncbi:MAG: alginate export family protein [Dokdonella sp.]
MIAKPACTLVLFFCLCAVASAQTPTMKPEWNLRLRHEQVDDAAFATNARADTLRLRAGLRFIFGSHWSALIEGEGVVAAGNNYNSGANGQTRYPAVIDPEGAELNQAWIAWHDTRFAATLGRQRILLDNQRWVGNVGWRQNEQTYDALVTEWKATDALTLKYDWLASVQRINGNRARDPLARDRDLNTHLFNVGYKRAAQQWVGYAYLHDDHDVASASTATFGLRWSADWVANGNGWAWTAEAARQRDYAENPLSFSHNYWLLEPGYSVRGILFKIGWEHLGGDGRHALQTPLATLHAFDGWADKFLTTPAGGLEDRYVSVGGKFGQIGEGRYAWAVAYHDYRADTATAGISNYGHEWNASLGFPLAKGLTALVKLADYRSDGFARDTTKFWLQLEWVGPK